MLKTIKNINSKHGNKLFTLGDQAIVSGGNFLLGIYLAKTLGLDVFGKYTLAYLCILFASSLQQAFIIAPIQSLSALLNKEEKENYIKNNSIIQFLFSILAATTTILFIAITGFASLNSSFLELSILGLFIFFFLINDYTRKVYYVKNNILMAIALDITTYVVLFIALFTLNQFQLLNFKTALITLTISYAFFIVFNLHLSVPKKINTPELKATTIKNWNYSKWLVGTSVLQWLSGNFFLISANTILGATAVGAVKIVQNIIGVLHILFLAIENKIPVEASNVYAKKGIKGLTTFLKKIAIQGLLLTLLTVAALSLCGDFIITQLYGIEYKQYSSLFYSFSILYIIIFLGMILRYAIRTLEKTQFIFGAYVISAIFSVLSANFIINTYGIQGVVLGFILTQVIMQLYFIFGLKKEISIAWKSFI